MYSFFLFFFWGAVLSDKRKRSVYDAGLFGFLGDDDDEVSIKIISPSRKNLKCFNCIWLDDTEEILDKNRGFVTSCKKW